jgi:NhaP-type Na+/H+ or K+/H+ antiporter
LQFFFPYDWDWKISLLLGGLLSATDPVAVVALMKELGASKKLNTIIEGESLMNDGLVILFQFDYQNQTHYAVLLTSLKQFLCSEGDL